MWYQYKQVSYITEAYWTDPVCLLSPSDKPEYDYMYKGAFRRHKLVLRTKQDGVTIQTDTFSILDVIPFLDRLSQEDFAKMSDEDYQIRLAAFYKEVDRQRAYFEMEQLLPDAIYQPTGTDAITCKGYFGENEIPDPEPEVCPEPILASLMRIGVLDYGYYGIPVARYTPYFEVTYGGKNMVTNGQWTDPNQVLEFQVDDIYGWVNCTPQQDGSVMIQNEPDVFTKGSTHTVKCRIVGKTVCITNAVTVTTPAANPEIPTDTIVSELALRTSYDGPVLTALPSSSNEFKVPALGWNASLTGANFGFQFDYVTRKFEEYTGGTWVTQNTGGTGFTLSTQTWAVPRRDLPIWYLFGGSGFDSRNVSNNGKTYNRYGRFRVSFEFRLGGSTGNVVGTRSGEWTMSQIEVSTKITDNTSEGRYTPIIEFVKYNGETVSTAGAQWIEPWQSYNEPTRRFEWSSDNGVTWNNLSAWFGATILLLNTGTTDQLPAGTTKSVIIRNGMNKSIISEAIQIKVPGTVVVDPGTPTNPTDPTGESDGGVTTPSSMPLCALGPFLDEILSATNTATRFRFRANDVYRFKVRIMDKGSILRSALMVYSGSATAQEKLDAAKPEKTVQLFENDTPFFFYEELTGTSTQILVIEGASCRSASVSKKTLGIVNVALDFAAGYPSYTSEGGLNTIRIRLTKSGTFSTRIVNKATNAELYFSNRRYEQDEIFTIPNVPQANYGVSVGTLSKDVNVVTGAVSKVYVPKVMSAGLPLHINLKWSGASEDWSVDDISDYVPQPGYEFVYKIQGLRIRQAGPLRNFRWQSNLPIQIMKMMFKPGLWLRDEEPGANDIWKTVATEFTYNESTVQVTTMFYPL